MPPVENLAGDAGADWMARGISALAAIQLTGTASVLPLPQERREPANGATQVLHVYMTSAAPLRLHAVVQDAAENTVTREFDVAGPDLATAADLLAKKISAAARPAPSTNSAAVESYARAVGDAAQAPELLAKAVEADPGFGAAWHALIQTRAVRGDMAGALEAARRAAGMTGLQAVERAKIALQKANLEGDAAARGKALKELAALLPLDPAVTLGMAEALYAAGDYKASAEGYLKTAELNPVEPEHLNRAGYALGLAGDLDGAAAAFQRYGQKNPANAADSLGEVYHGAGRFAEASRQFQESYRIQPAMLSGHGSLLKAALSQRMTGDLAGAETLFRQFLELRRKMNDPALVLYEAQWLMQTGRRKQAAELLGKAMASAPEQVKPLVLPQLAALLFEGGDRATAQRLAEQAFRLPAPGLVKIDIASLAFAFQPHATPAEWEARAARLFPDPRLAAVRQRALGLALLLDGHYAEAIPRLRPSPAVNAPGSEGLARVLLGWALLEAGRADEAMPYLAQYPFPSHEPAPAVTALVFPRQLDLLARALAKTKPEESRRLAALFAKFKS